MKQGGGQNSCAFRNAMWLTDMDDLVCWAWTATLELGITLVLWKNHVSGNIQSQLYPSVLELGLV